LFALKKMKGAKMPYQNISGLPDRVHNNLPQHAQEIYRAAFNSAWDEYDHDEERAHRVAWSAVENKYEKDDRTSKWKAKDGSGDKLWRARPNCLGIRYTRC
jgi:cation transport regulator